MTPIKKKNPNILEKKIGSEVVKFGFHSELNVFQNLCFPKTTKHTDIFQQKQKH